MSLMRVALLCMGVLGCGGGPVELDPPPPLRAGAPVAGAAEGTLKLPVGTPLGGFTSRCECLGGSAWKDERESAYATGFNVSTGVHIRPTIKALWIENGDQHMVMTKTDTAYSFDGLVAAVTARLEIATGLDLGGQVMHAANHNHSSYGTFSAHTGLFLGSDRFHRENFERMADQVADVALEAYNRREAAALGIGWAKDWDPDDQVYSDRRPENDALVMWDDAGAEQGRKDPYMQLIRVDAVSDGRPLAVVMSWGMHPYVFGADSALATADATALVEAEVAESFDHQVVAMFLQTSGGDTSVRGGDTGWARMESVGLRARDAVLALHDATPTSDAPIVLEATGRSVSSDQQDIEVLRDGTVDWRYLPYDEFYRADDVVYDAQGELLSPLDEFNTQWGAAFCGSGDFVFPVGGLNTDHPAYRSCMKTEALASLIQVYFGLDEREAQLPLQGMAEVYTGVARVGPLPVRRATGEVVTQDVLMGFFPGEPLSMYTEQWRRRAKDELGYEDALLYGYAMDHTGYLALPEDWLLGGYEPDITFHGPLHGEYLMEAVLDVTEEVLGTDVDEVFQSATGPSSYRLDELSTTAPDTTPSAGTPVGLDNAPEYVWTPENLPLDLAWRDAVPRVQGAVQFAWEGGDPGVDNPRVTLQRRVGDAWEAVTSRSGRPINEDHHDFVLTHTPYPLAPAEAQQRHYWWVMWQAVGHIHDRPGLPEGTYRLHVEGASYTGQATSWPWDTEAYSLSSAPFEVTPAEVTVSEDDDGLWASLEGPEWGYRLIDPNGSSQGHNPLVGAVTIRWVLEDDVVEQVLDVPEHRDGKTLIPWGPMDAESATIEDVYGNEGAWTRSSS